MTPPGISNWGSGLDPGTNNNLNYHRVPVPSGDRHLGQPQFVVAERVFRRDPREDVIRRRRLHGSLYKFGKAELYGGNTKFIDDRQAAAIGSGMKNSWTTG